MGPQGREDEPRTRHPPLKSAEGVLRHQASLSSLPGDCRLPSLKPLDQALSQPHTRFPLRGAPLPLPVTCRRSGLGDPAFTPPLNEQHHPPGHRSSGNAQADLFLRMRRDPAWRAVSLSNRIESLRQGRSIGSHGGGGSRGGSEWNQSETSPNLDRHASSNCRECADGFTAGKGWGLPGVRRREGSNQPTKSPPPPHPHPPRTWFTAPSSGSDAAADWLLKAWSHPSDPKVLEGGGGGGPVQSASRKPPACSPRGWHLGPCMTRDLAAPRPPVCPRSWEPSAPSVAAPAPSSQTRAAPRLEPGLPPCTPAPRLPGGQDRRPSSARPSGCSLGWGREAPRRIRNTRVRPCLECLFNGEVGECGEGWKEEEKQQLKRQVKSVTSPEGKGAGWEGESLLLPVCS